MANRRPPPTYEETLGRGEDALNSSNRMSVGGGGGFVPGAVPGDYRSNNRTSGASPGGRMGNGGAAGALQAATAEIRQSLHGRGFRVRSLCLFGKFVVQADGRRLVGCVMGSSVGCLLTCGYQD